MESLVDIQIAAQKALKFKQAMSYEDFCEDEKTQSAIVFQLLIIGEATKRLSMALRSQYPNIPWSLMAGMRDNLIHDYDDISEEAVWDTCENDIPSLLPLIKFAIESIKQLNLDINDPRS